LKIDGKPVSATLLGETLTFFHCGRAQVAKGNFYIILFVIFDLIVVVF